MIPDSSATADGVHQEIATPRKPFVPLASRARWAVAALVATGLADLVSIVLDWNRFALLDRIETGGDFTLSEVAASDHRQAVIGVVQVCLFAVTAVVFIRWFRRAYLNVEALGAERRFGAGWAIGGWFVPILSLWRPKQIANDLWHTSDPGDAAQRSSRGGSSPLLTWWWVTFVVAAWITARAAISAGNTADDLKRSTILDLVGAGIDVAAVGLAVAVVVVLTARQAQRAQRRAEIT